MKNKLNINDLINKVKTYNDKNTELIEKTYDFILKNNLCDEDKLESIFSIALILTDIHIDETSICAALLYESINDDKEKLSIIKKEFNKDIVSLIEGLLKVGQINFSNSMFVNNEYYKKILVGMSEDVRVIIIVLAERLYYMRNLGSFPVKTQQIRAKESLDIFSPIAHRLGIYIIKSELDDLSLKYLKPDVYADIEAKLNQTKNERNETVNIMLNILTNLLKENNIKHYIKGRAKSIYSIYKKLDKGRPFSDIYDLYALRIIVDTEQECYLALGIIHSHFKPIPKRFKDMIAMPKSNMYQSLHTTVFGPDGVLYEIQIRTHEMDEIAEYGFAAHWTYKEQVSPKVISGNSVDQKLELFRSIMAVKNENTSTDEFVNKVKNDIINTHIYVYTPKGDVVELPDGSTPIDFAYKVHSGVGEKMVGAIVNNVIVPLEYILHDGDIVKITTNKNSPGPSKEWLKIAKSAQTKDKIKAYFNKIDKNDLIEKGKEALEKELRKRKIPFKDLFTDDNINLIISKLKLIDLDELYVTIGSNHNTPTYIINLLMKDDEDNTEIITYKNESDLIKLQNTKDLLLVKGIDSIKINLASCCMPVIGDEIIGYISKDKGIVAHRIDCFNISNIDERKIDIYWNKNIEKKLPTNITIETDNREDTLINVVSLAGTMNISIDSIKTKDKNNYIIYDIIVLVENIDTLNIFIDEINKFPYIRSISRKIR